MSLFYLRRKSVFVAGTALLGAVVVVLDLVVRFKIPFPPLPYLKFDVLGIPMLLSTFLFGFLSGSITSLIAWLTISTRDWFSGFMKFTAEFSTLIGVYVVLRARSLGIAWRKILAMISGVLLRVVVMAVANVALLPVFMPAFYKTYDAVVVLIPLISLFNAAQGVVSVFGGFLVYEAVVLRFPSLKHE